MTTIMRISFLLAREDNPRLYDELAQFPKGQRRVNRLRTMAYDGLLAQQGSSLGSIDRASGAVVPAITSPVVTERIEASLELFSSPIAD